MQHIVMIRAVVMIVLTGTLAYGIVFIGQHEKEQKTILTTTGTKSL